MACRVGGLPPLPPWLSPLALISRDQPPQQPMRMPGLPACSAPRLSALPINTRTRTPPPPPLPSCTRIRTLCPLASPPTADYLPSPLDVNNFALDLDKGEERVLLPCSMRAGRPGRGAMRWLWGACIHLPASQGIHIRVFTTAFRSTPLSVRRFSG